VRGIAAIALLTALMAVECDPQDGDGIRDVGAASAGDAGAADVEAAGAETASIDSAAPLTILPVPPADPPSDLGGTGYPQVLCCTTVACSAPRTGCPPATPLELPVSAPDGGPIDPLAYQAILETPCTPPGLAACKTTGLCFWPFAQSPVDAGDSFCLAVALSGAVQAAPAALRVGRDDAGQPVWSAYAFVRGNLAFLPAATPIAEGWQISGVVLPGISHGPGTACAPTGGACDRLGGDACCAIEDRCVPSGDAVPGATLPGVCGGG
jgi:hypothetical protein